MNWKRENYGYHTSIAECHARVTMLYDRNLRRDTLTATVITTLFPEVERTDFNTYAEAKAWCEQWMNFAVELLELRTLTGTMREQRQKDFAEIMALRNELHDYRYPRAIESEKLS